MSSPSSSSQFNGFMPVGTPFADWPQVVALRTTVYTKAGIGIFVGYNYNRNAVLIWFYPVDEDGNLIAPSMLNTYHRTHDIYFPSCFCPMKGSTPGNYCEAVVLKPRSQTSPAYDCWCFACPTKECRYFVNIDRVLELSPPGQLKVSTYAPRGSGPSSPVHYSSPSVSRRYHGSPSSPQHLTRPLVMPTPSSSMPSFPMPSFTSSPMPSFTSSPMPSFASSSMSTFPFTVFSPITNKVSPSRPESAHISDEDIFHSFPHSLLSPTTLSAPTPLPTPDLPPGVLTSSSPVSEGASGYSADGGSSADTSFSSVASSSSISSTSKPAASLLSAVKMSIKMEEKTEVKKEKRKIRRHNPLTASPSPSQRKGKSVRFAPVLREVTPPPRVRATLMDIWFRLDDSSNPGVPYEEFCESLVRCKDKHCGDVMGVNQMKNHICKGSVMARLEAETIDLTSDGDEVESN